MTYRLMVLLLTAWVSSTIYAQRTTHKHPVVTVAVEILDPQVRENLGNLMEEIAADAASAVAAHVQELAEFVEWKPSRNLVWKGTDALLKMQVAQRPNRLTYLRFDVLDDRSKIPLSAAIQLWAPNEYTRPTDDAALLKQDIRTVLDDYFGNQSASDAFRTSLLEAIPVARGVKKDVKDPARTYFIIGIPWESLQPGSGLIFSMSFDAPVGKDIAYRGTIFLAPLAKYRNKIIATPIHACKHHPVIFPPAGVKTSDTACDTSQVSPELPDVLRYMTSSVLANASIRIHKYQRSHFGL